MIYDIIALYISPSFWKFWTEHCFPLKAPTCELHFSIFLESFELNSGFLYGHVLSIKLGMICSRVSQFGAFKQFTLHLICSYCIKTWISFNNERADY